MKSESVSFSVLSDCDPMECNLLGSSVMGFSRQEYWSGLPFPFPRDLPNPGIEPGSPVSWADFLPSEPPRKPRSFKFQIQLSLSNLETLVSSSIRQGFPGGASGKKATCQCRRHKRQGFNPWVGKISWRRKWKPTAVFLSG